MKPPSGDKQYFRSFDGTQIAYYHTGEGTPILLCNGFGGGWESWAHQIDFFEPNFQLISWDYRGLSSSSAPPYNSEAFTIHDHALDGLQVLRQFGFPKVILMGWSLGAQVALELYRMASTNVDLLILLNGAAGNVEEVSRAFRWIKRIFKSAFFVSEKAPFLDKNLPFSLLKQPEIFEWLKRVGLIAPSVDEDLLLNIFSSLPDNNLQNEKQIVDNFLRFDSTDILEKIKVPTLLIAGNKDFMIPRKIVEDMVRRIPEVELLMIPSATHFSILEYPELINLRIEKFIKEKLFARHEQAE